MRLDPQWLEKLTAPWQQPGPAPIAAAGFFLPDAEGVFQTAMAATVLPLPEDAGSAERVLTHLRRWVGKTPTGHFVLDLDHAPQDNLEPED